MVIHSDLDGLTDAQARRALEGLPRSDYEIVIKPLRYRTSPHLAARCEFEERRIVLQVPVPFRPFKEPVIYSARRKRGRGLRFAWASESVSPRSAAIPLLPRMDALVSEGSAGQAFGRGDSVRPIRAAQFQAPQSFHRGRRRRPAAPRTSKDSNLAAQLDCGLLLIEVGQR